MRYNQTKIILNAVKSNSNFLAENTILTFDMRNVSIYYQYFDYVSKCINISKSIGIYIYTSILIHSSIPVDLSIPVNTLIPIDF